MTDEPPKEPPKPGVPESAASLETGPTAEPREPGSPTIEVAPHAFEAQPREAQTIEAQAVDYEPAPIPFDAPEQATATVSAPAAAGEDAILPSSLDDNALRDAVGAPPARPTRKKRAPTDDDAPPRPGNRRVVVLAALALLAALGVGAFVLLGRANAQRYAIACTTDQVSAEQGRAFPPWGTRPLLGAEWKPITLPANAECKPRETDDRAELEGWFLELLVERASTTLTARDLLDSIQPGRTNPLDVVAAQLNQALLLSRAPERRDQRKEVERLLGDVQYWRASLRLREAAAALADAARQFDAAAAQRPRHVTDAGEWAAFLRGLVDHLQTGPSGAAAAPAQAVGEPVSERPTAPAGTALPVEPESPAGEPEPAAPPDAGLPTGGVLL